MSRVSLSWFLIRFWRSSMLRFARKLLANTCHRADTNAAEPKRFQRAGINPQSYLSMSLSSAQPPPWAARESRMESQERRVKNPTLAVPASPAAPNPYSAGIVVEQAHRQCYAIGGREGSQAKEISSLGRVLRRPPVAGLQQFSLREDVRFCPVACSFWNSGRFFYSPGLGPGGDIAATTQQAAMPPRQIRPTISFLPRCAGSTAIRGGQSK